MIQEVKKYISNGHKGSVFEYLSNCYTVEERKQEALAIEKDQEIVEDCEVVFEIPNVYCIIKIKEKDGSVKIHEIIQL